MDTHCFWQALRTRSTFRCSQEARGRLIADGQEPGGGSPEELDKFIRNEIAKYTKVIKAAGINPE